MWDLSPVTRNQTHIPCIVRWSLNYWTTREALIIFKEEGRVIIASTSQGVGLPWRLRRWRICLQCKRPGFDPWVRKIPWRRPWQPTPVFLPGESSWTEEPGGLQPMRSQRVRLDWAAQLSSAHRWLWELIKPFLCAKIYNTQNLPFLSYLSAQVCGITFTHTAVRVHHGRSSSESFHLRPLKPCTY